MIDYLCGFLAIIASLDGRYKSSFC